LLDNAAVSAFSAAAIKGGGAGFRRVPPAFVTRAALYAPRLAFIRRGAGKATCLARRWGGGTTARARWWLGARWSLALLLVSLGQESFWSANRPGVTVHQPIRWCAA